MTSNLFFNFTEKLSSSFFSLKLLNYRVYRKESRLEIIQKYFESDKIMRQGSDNVSLQGCWYLKVLTRARKPAGQDLRFEHSGSNLVLIFLNIRYNWVNPSSIHIPPGQSFFDPHTPGSISRKFKTWVDPVVYFFWKNIHQFFKMV